MFEAVGVSVLVTNGEDIETGAGAEVNVLLPGVIVGVVYGSVAGNTLDALLTAELSRDDVRPVVTDPAKELELCELMGTMVALDGSGIE